MDSTFFHRRSHCDQLHSKLGPRHRLLGSASNRSVHSFLPDHVSNSWHDLHVESPSSQQSRNFTCLLRAVCSCSGQTRNYERPSYLNQWHERSHYLDFVLLQWSSNHCLHSQDPSSRRRDLLAGTNLLLRTHCNYGWSLYIYAVHKRWQHSHLHDSASHAQSIAIFAY
jgi:hypothetical protein